MLPQIKIFKSISVLEAISYLVLLFIAVPLKHLFDAPLAVRVVGSLHGLLFVLYVLGAFMMKRKLGWSVKILLISLLCSVLPFGPFYVEKHYLPKTS